MFPRRVRYALLALQNLARAGDGYCAAHRIADDEAISHRFLDLILGELRQLGLVESLRGLRGGYRLAAATHDLTLFDILTLLKEQLAPLPCLADPQERCSECFGPSPCALRPALSAAFDSYRAELSALRLADLANGASLMPSASNSLRPGLLAHAGASDPGAGPQAADRPARADV
jgi:Rrf2 family protein